MQKHQVQTSKILEFLSTAAPSVFGEDNDPLLTGCSSVFDAVERTFCFATVRVENAGDLIDSIRNSLVLVDPEFEIKQSYLTTNCIVKVDHPRLWYARALGEFFENLGLAEIHSTAVLDPGCVLGEGVAIGAYSVIGRNCSVGDGTRIGSQVVIYDNVSIGRNCVIDSSAVIGKTGWGYPKDEEGNPVKFPHLGDVVIGDWVDIGSHVSIDRGALSATKIGDHTKIDSHAHIGHNSQVGQRCMILGHALLSGSVTVGDDVWIGAGVVTSDYITIGDRAWVSLGSTVVRHVKEGQKVSGYFARDHEKYLRMMLDQQRKYFK